MSRDWSCRAGFSVWLNAKPRFRRIRCTARTFLMAFWNLVEKNSAVETSGDQRGLLCLPWPIVWNVVLLDLLRNVVRCRHIRPPITVRRARSVLWGERNCVAAHYFHTKSRQRQIAGTRRSVNQKTLSVNSSGSSPQYSRENPILGAMTM
jgi:hypothetical protein